MPSSHARSQQFQRILALGSLCAASFAFSANMNPIRLNQLGFLPSVNKQATIANASTTPLDWAVLNAEGKTLASGKTQVFGQNKASGEHVHIADFSDIKDIGTGYVLTVAGQKSHPFQVSPKLYSQLKSDALTYFYHNRSGIEINAKFVGKNYARPAGHKPEKVKCFSSRDDKGNKWDGCDYSLDVTGGWYDAGDHGKYVVNGGIALWTLLNQYERSQFVKTANPNTFVDGTLPLPEQDNKVNDLLDEARWEMEFLLAMQVPAGKKMNVPLGDQSSHLNSLEMTETDVSGLVHHKIADDSWTGEIPPHMDPKSRYLFPPSTAATLNMAATAAQAARIWKTIDPAFSERCLSAAESAWAAAKRVPNLYAYANFTGSGGYEDSDVTDEFYWAAAELFVTTGKGVYEKSLRSSKHFLETPKAAVDGNDELTWGYLAPAGTISLALVPNKLPAADVKKARANLVGTGKRYADQIKNEGYGLPYTATIYPWGSNSAVLNRALILGLAYDFNKDATLLNAVSASMDYLLGRNPLDQSYVAGYGFRPLKTPHHRFWRWLYRKDDDIVAPAGAISGGPNSLSLDDPVSKNYRGKCTGQTCWVDDPGAWTFNEVAVNWNAPLAWVAAFLDEQGK